jgi:hypothetical protein
MNLHAPPASIARPASASALVNCLRDRSCRLGVVMETSGSSEFHSRDSIQSGGEPLVGSRPDPPLEKTCSGTGREAGPRLTVRCYNTGSALGRDFPSQVSDAWSAGPVARSSLLVENRSLPDRAAHCAEDAGQKRSKGRLGVDDGSAGSAVLSGGRAAKSRPGRQGSTGRSRLNRACQTRKTRP